MIQSLFKGLYSQSLLSSLLYNYLHRPYKKAYMNIADSILLSHVATLRYIITSLPDKKSRPCLFVPLMQTIIFLPFMVVILMTAYRIAQCGILRHLQCFLKYLKRAVKVTFYGRIIPQTQMATKYGTINRD